MLHSIAVKTLRDLRTGFVFWSAGLAGLVAMMVSVYPSVRDNPALDKLVESYPEALKGFFGFGGELDYATPAGYLGMELFSFMVPLLLLVATIGAGSAAIAREEERGTLDLLLSLPVSRSRVVLEKLGALVAETAALGVVLWLALWVGAAAVGMAISATLLAAATASAVALAIAYGAIALALGAATGKRGFSIGIAAALAVAAYLVNSLAPLAVTLEHMQKASPFYYYAASNPLQHGLDTPHLLVLVGITVGAAALAVVAFDRRDLST
jgi:ABC-2 type transport system permease protein